MAPGGGVHLGATVCDVQSDPAIAGRPSITVASGEVLSADLIVGADGARSTLPKAVTGIDDRATPTGDVAYCAAVGADLKFEDPSRQDA